MKTEYFMKSTFADKSIKIVQALLAVLYKIPFLLLMYTRDLQMTLYKLYPQQKEQEDKSNKLWEI